MHQKRSPFIGIAILTLLLASAHVLAEVTIRQIPGQAELGTVEIHNVAAGAFDPAVWRAGKLHFVPDARSPMITPRLDGVYRNIYAPSAVETPEGWQLFYGAWDGVPTGNDRIYRVLTSDFLNFSEWQIVIEHGPFQHVCNVSAVRDSDRSVHMLCTAYPVGSGLNKPAAFTIDTRSNSAATGGTGTPLPIVPSNDDLATIEGYEPFAAADMNGVNTLLFDDGQYRLYFGDFKNWGKVYRAVSTDGKHFRFEGVALPAPLMVNDVKKFTPQGRPCYLMGLHANTDRLWYALSTDGERFEPQRELITSGGPADRYIVAIGWVTKSDRLAGVLYGAGAAAELNRNRLFARWLQKKIVFTDPENRSVIAETALGPDRAILALGGEKERVGRIQVFAEDGVTALSKPMSVKLTSGAIYRIEGEAKQ